MKVQELRKLLDIYNDDDEIEFYEIISRKYIETITDIAVADAEPAFVPILKVDVDLGGTIRG